jgi:hypothetical protein
MGIDAQALLRGAWDIHVHAAPSIFERWGDAWELADACRAAGMAGFVFKFHHGSTAEAAALMQKKEPLLRIHGGVTLNRFVGGLNPLAVETCKQLGGRIVWLPTIHAQFHGDCFCTLAGFSFQASGLKHHPHAHAGLSILDEQGEVCAPLREIIDLMKGSQMVLATGHISPLEIFALKRYIDRETIDVKLLLNHVFFRVPALSADQIADLVGPRVWFETVYLEISPMVRATTPARIAAAVQRMPEAQWVMASDSGQKHNPPSPQALATFVGELSAHGVDEATLVKMLHDNPRRLLDD